MPELLVADLTVAMLNVPMASEGIAGTGCKNKERRGESSAVAVQLSLTDSRIGLQLTPLIIYALAPFLSIYFYSSLTGSHTAAAGPLS